jgi:hypothetical protein
MSRRVITTKPLAATDFRSDVCFMNRQKEIRTLYREFRSAMDTVKQIAAGPPAPISEEEEQEEELGKPQICARPLEDAVVILKEIVILETETAEIRELLSNPKLAQNRRVQAVKTRLRRLRRINSRLRRRAEALFNVW